MSLSADRPTWPRVLSDRMVKDEYLETYAGFLATFYRMDIRPEHTHGHIAVVGQGPAFPERTLLCNDKLLEHLKPEISLLTTFDSEYYSSPDHWLEDVKTLRSPSGKRLAKLTGGAVAHYSWGAAWAIREYHIPPNFFNTVFAFQIVDLGKQFEAGLLDALKYVTKPGGHIIASGGTIEGYYETLERNNSDIRILQKLQLPNPGYSGYPFNEHVGIIIQKK